MPARICQKMKRYATTSVRMKLNMLTPTRMACADSGDFAKPCRIKNLVIAERSSDPTGTKLFGTIPELPGTLCVGRLYPELSDSNSTPDDMMVGLFSRDYPELFFDDLLHRQLCRLQVLVRRYLFVIV